MKDEVELSETKEGYEIIPVTPLRRLQKRVEVLEKAGTIPQLQSLITQIIELVKTNQNIINEIVKANSDLRIELSKIPKKIDELIETMKDFMDLIETAGSEEIVGPGTESIKPLIEEIKKLSEENKKLIENNTAIMEALETINKKIKRGTPVSALLSSYPNIKLKKRG
ncbi:MAG: hypothetical protein J7K26_03810 [Candidatus Aenigmarchaeota archaeon]|nr:hypothetical protein [Candidatus Aenigmarchaeota archaeon]